MIQNWVQIINPCSQGLGRCHVTRQHYSAAPAPKLSAEQKSSFPVIARCWGDLSSQIGKELASWHVHQAQGFNRDGRKELCNHFQCWHIFPLCEKRQVLLQHLPCGRTLRCMILPEGIWQSRPSIKTCPCVWMVPSRKWIWWVARQVLHVPLDWFADWESGHFWDIERNTQHEPCCQCSAPAIAGHWLQRSKGKTPTCTKMDTNRGSKKTDRIHHNTKPAQRWNLQNPPTQYDKNKNTIKTNAKSGKSTPKEHNSTTQTRSYQY